MKDWAPKLAGAAALIITLLEPCAAQVAQKSTPFSPGETLTYDVVWSIFPAGEVSATLRAVNDGPRDSYEVVTKARSQGFVSLLFPVNNEFHSRFDPQSLCSGGITKQINEGRRHKDSRITFDAGRKLALLNERDLAHPGDPPKLAENPIPPCVEDIVSAFYYLRRQNFRVGQSIHLPLNDGAKTFDVTVEVQARERIQTPLGTRDAFRVEPKVFSGFFKRKGRMLIWFSDDAQRLPLRIKAMITAGSLTGTLRAVSAKPVAAGNH